MVVQAPLLQRVRMLVSYLPNFTFEGMRYFRSWLQHEKIHSFDGKLRINSFIPPWPSLAHKRLLHAAFSKDRIPFQVYYAITGNCPCHCDHCSYAKRSGQELSVHESLQFIDDAKKLGCSLIGFTGGEPLLRKDLELMIAACKPELATILFTTGHGLTVKRAEALKQAGLDWFTVGFESANEHQHDTVRKFPGSFQQAVQTLHVAQEAGLYTAISTVASKSKVNDGEIERLYEFSKNHSVNELRIIPYVATGGGVDDAEEMLGLEEYRFLTSFHKEINKKKTGPVIESFSYIESEELFGCGAGYHHFFVDAAGNVCPCDLTPLSFGKVTEESLSIIWKKMKKYFPKPRSYCIMKQIAPKLKERKRLPVPFDESSRFVPPLKKKDTLPKMYTFLKKNR